MSALAVMPLEQHDSKDSVKEKLIERGGQVENLIGCKFRAYSGIAWRIGCIGQIEKFTTKGRVVIDASGWNRFNPDDAVFLSPL